MFEGVFPALRTLLHCRPILTAFLEVLVTSSHDGNSHVFCLEFCQSGRSKEDLFISKVEEFSNHKNNSSFGQTPNLVIISEKTFIDANSWHRVLWIAIDETLAKSKTYKEPEICLTCSWVPSHNLHPYALDCTKTWKGSLSWTGECFKRWH